VVVGALGTVYALAATGSDVAGQVAPLIAREWSFATAAALLAWYVFAPQCLSTLVTARRETNGWRYPLLMVAYQFTLAYVAAGATYHLCRAFAGTA
jgi:ferrous iron transport protein B